MLNFGASKPRVKGRPAAPPAPDGSAPVSDVSIIPNRLLDVSKSSSSMDKLVLELRCLNHTLELVTGYISFNVQAIDKSKFVFKYIWLTTTSNLFSI